MSKGKVAPPARTLQAVPKSYALTDITITLPAPRDFSGDPEGKTVTIGGPHLAMMLAWLERSNRTLSPATPTNDGGLYEVQMDLMGLGEVLLGLSTADLSGNAIDDAPVFRFLYKIASDLAAQLSAIHDAAEVLKHATVTLGAAPVMAAAS